jgi:hypothetical protein
MILWVLVWMGERRLRCDCDCVSEREREEKTIPAPFLRTEASSTGCHATITSDLSIFIQRISRLHRGEILFISLGDRIYFAYLSAPALVQTYKYLAGLVRSFLLAGAVTVRGGERKGFYSHPREIR